MQSDCFPDATKDWPKSPVSALARQNPRYSVRKGTEYPFIEMASVGENFRGILRIDTRKMEGSGLTRFKVNDTLFAKITPCPENGKIAFVDELPAELGIGSTEFIVLSPRQGTNPRFLFHLACSHALRGRAAARMEGSTGRQRVPEDVFDRRLLVPVPSPDEQAAISHVLDAVDTAIEKARESVSRSTTLRKSLLADLLNRGVDEHGHVRDPARSKEHFANTPFGLFPKCWRWSHVGNEFDLQNGFTLNETRRARLKRRRYLRVANVHRDALRLDDIQELEANDTEFAPRVLEFEDLLVVEGHADRMQIGRCARVTGQAVGLTFQNHLFRLRTRGEVLPYFGCLWLNSSHAQRYWNARCATSSGLNTINQRTLKRLYMPVPSEPEQRIISSVIARHREHLDGLDRNLSNLMAAKKSLMHDLLTGTVRVDPALFREERPS